MTNEQRAVKLIKHLGFNFESVSKDEIRGLIEQEMTNYQSGSSEYIRLLCGHLYCLSHYENFEADEE